MPIDWMKFIERDARIACGKPVFKGTRLTVEYILERLSQGAKEDDLLQDITGLKPEHIQAALSYAAAVVRQDEVVYHV